jgi:hypothetical protein
MSTRTTILVLAIALVVGGCSPDDAAETTTTLPTTTTTAPTTTTTVDPAEVAADTCNSLKVAAFDLDASITSGLQDLGVSGESDLADAEVGRLVVENLVEFYDEIGSLAPDAPGEVSAALETVADAVQPWRDALDQDPAEFERTLEELEPEDLGSAELDEAVAALDEWTEAVCGTKVPVGPEEILFTTVFAAMFGALGSIFGDFGDDFTVTEDFTEASDTALAYGDDPALDQLYSDCGLGDGQACRDLYFSAYGEYELWGQTCGASIPLRRAFVVDCDEKFSSDASAYGDDFVLDTLWDECAAGDQDSCDGLFAAAPIGSEYESFGGSCAGARMDGDYSRPCSFVASGEPFSYGDDPSFDMLWDLCARGDGVACDDLFFQTPISSAYEAFGRVCSDLTAVGHSCENVTIWLGGPFG